MSRIPFIPPSPPPSEVVAVEDTLLVGKYHVQNASRLEMLCFYRLESKVAAHHFSSGREMPRINRFDCTLVEFRTLYNYLSKEPWSWRTDRDTPLRVDLKIDRQKLYAYQEQLYRRAALLRTDSLARIIALGPSSED